MSESDTLQQNSLNDSLTVEIPERVILRRIGVEGELEFVFDDRYDGDLLWSWIDGILPRVELIQPINRLSDAVSLGEIDSEEQSFLRGIFYYAGIYKDEWDGIFERTDRTIPRLRNASAQLNDTLSHNWSQGQELKFTLLHNSSANQIDLLIEDPAVEKRDVRAFRRSAGFTSFFALKTILHSREQEAQARSYIWIFDEPGLYLHPLGQHDLIQVMETLAEYNQAIYCTHSLLMINKNYPARHRLLVKDHTGTRVDGKPYIGNWKSAMDALVELPRFRGRLWIWASGG